MQNRTKELEAKKATISEIETQINTLRVKIDSINSDMYRIKENRVHVLRTWYNARIDKSEFLECKLGYVTNSYLPSHDYMVELIQKVLKKQTLNNQSYRTDYDLYYNMTYYINNHYSYYVTNMEVELLVKKYKTRNAKTLIKKLEFENKLKLRKQRLTSLIVGNRGYRVNERNNMTDYERAIFWYKDKMAKFANNSVQKFKTLLNAKGINSYDIMFNYSGNDLKNWHEAITKKHTMTLGQLKALAYKQIKKQYIQAINEYNNAIAKDVKEKALQKHQLAAMTAKQRKALQFEKWSKVKNVLNMFNGAIEINKKITFENYKPVPTKPTVTEVKNVMNDCGVVETHETLSDGTTTVSLYV